jgi:hypothetical protein
MWFQAPIDHVWISKDGQNAAAITPQGLLAAETHSEKIEKR